jgi:hypothetical protein
MKFLIVSSPWAPTKVVIFFEGVGWVLVLDINNFSTFLTRLAGLKMIIQVECVVIKQLFDLLTVTCEFKSKFS